MKRFAGLAVVAGLMVAASAANAQMPAPYQGVSDFDGPYERPYGAVPPAPPPPVYNNYGGYGPSLLPLPEVYAVLRDNGFSPLGAPYQRGLVYVIAAMDRNGQDGRLAIDARNGRSSASRRPMVMAAAMAMAARLPTARISSQSTCRPTGLTPPCRRRS